MLARVLARSRLDDQWVEKSEGPKGLLDDPKMFVRCGMDPALSRDNVVPLPPTPTVAVCEVDSTPDNPGGLKGLVDGVGREVLDSRDCCDRLLPFKEPTPGNRDGMVPARVLRAGLCRDWSVADGIKSGNSSWLGDSGMFSRRGVEWPLDGGPQMFGETPSWA